MKMDLQLNQSDFEICEKKTPQNDQTRDLQKLMLAKILVQK